LLALCSANASAIAIFQATLTGLNEVPANGSPAIGNGTFILDDAGTQLSFDIDYAGLIGGPVSGAHFHNAPAGVNGPIVRGIPLPLPSPNGDIVGVWSSLDAQPLTPALVAELLAGNIYFNIHTNGDGPPDFPGGEIRGQLHRVPEPTSALLVGAAIVALGFARRRRFR
jgi:hypothetical protein